MLIDAIRRAFGFFDSNGLRYSTSHLRSIQKEIAYYPIDKQARYADAITVAGCKNSYFIMSCAASLDKNRLVDGSFNYYFVNATAIGNAAYMVLHCDDKEFCKKLLSFLAGYKRYVEKSKQLEW